MLNSTSILLPIEIMLLPIEIMLFIRLKFMKEGEMVLPVQLQHTL